MHRFIPESGEPAPPLDPAHTAAIKRWTAETLRLAPDATVLVQELACADAGCPLVETAVSVFIENDVRTWRFTRPRVAVTKAMIQQALAAAPRHV